MVLLESSKLFCHLLPGDLAKVRKVTREQSYSPNEPIFKEGDPGDGIYVVKDGIVSLTKVVAQGEARPLSRATEGDVFGEMAVFDDNPRSLGAVAEGKAAVYFIAKPDLLDLLDHTPRLAVAIVRDNSKRIRDFNEKYIKEVLEAERLSLVGRFASSIVHDLKNPLNIIGISADMACMPSATPESRLVSKGRIRKQVERISNMVNELLEFVQGSHTNFILARVDYSAFVLQLMEEIQQEVALKSVTLEFLNQPPPVLVQINPQRLARVFHNFIGNAADAMPNGGKVRLSFSINSQQAVVTEMHDTGHGIPPQMLDRLFQAFATYGKASGTGLGLAICKRIIQDHQGAVFARNAPEGGAVFGFTLPASKPTGS
ncbi:MAG: ATP-binding protein [Verrucomicrobiota bacterium]|jgi:signal transduction histidine kinase